MTQSTVSRKMTTAGRLVVSPLACLLLVGCTSSSGSPGTGTGGATGPDSGASGGRSGGSGGSAPGSAGTTVSGSGGASTGGTGGGPGSGGAAGSGGSAGATGGGIDAGGMAGGAGGGTATGCAWSSPDGRISLFDGTSLDGWQNTNTGGVAHWRIDSDGTLLVVPANPSANLQTKMKFDDLCLHAEYLTPMYPDSVTGQARGNSGIYLRRSYEMQVLDSYGQPAAIDGCGAAYSVSPPLVVACNMQLVWNTYEIEFKAARWDASGGKTSDASFVLVTLNGKVVQRNVDLRVPSTTSGQPDMAGPQPLMLQDHGNPVRFRNIWAKVPRY